MTDNEKLEQQLLRIGAFWRHPGNPDVPHALLASGMHSDGFLNLSILASYPRILREFTEILAAKFRERIELKDIFENPRDCWFIGSAMGAIPVALQLAEQLNFRAGYAEKTVDGKMNFDRYECERERIKKILIVEDVLTTGSTTQKTLKAVEEKGLADRLLPFIGVLINRTQKNEIEFELLGEKRRFELISTAQLYFNVWQPDDCPLCREGSQTIKPKKQWAKLVADFIMR